MMPWRTGEVNGPKRAWLIFRTADPEPTEFMNALLMLLAAYSILPTVAPLPGSLAGKIHLYHAVGWVCLALGLQGLKSTLIVPCGLCRPVGLILSVMVWVLLGTNLLTEFGMTVRSLLCLIFAGAAAWAVIRVAQRGG